MRGHRRFGRRMRRPHRFLFILAVIIAGVVVIGHLHEKHDRWNGPWGDRGWTRGGHSWYYEDSRDRSVFEKEMFQVQSPRGWDGGDYLVLGLAALVGLILTSGLGIAFVVFGKSRRAPSTSRSDLLRLKQVFDGLERRLGRIETLVTDKEFDWERRLVQGK